MIFLMSVYEQKNGIHSAVFYILGSVYMEQYSSTKLIRSKVVYTVAVVFVLVSLILSMVNYVYNRAESEAFETLHLQTKEIKENIELQIISDRENLSTMANFAAKLYSDGENYDLMFNSFEAIGLIRDIGILTRENMFVTKIGKMKVTGTEFEDEVRKGEYISGRVPDMTYPGREVIRSAVPIKVGTEIVGILYGIIDLKDFEQKYKELAEPRDAKLYVAERGTGNLIVDTRNPELGNLSDFKERKEKRGYSYNQMYNDIITGNAGYSAYMPKNSDEYYYVHYSPMNISDWQILMAKPESVVFENARETESRIFLVVGLVAAIMAIYLIMMFASEKKQSMMNLYASKIRKLLLEINQNHGSIIESLEIITGFSDARSAFYVDTDGEDFCYINSVYKSSMIIGDNRAYFISRLIEYVRSNLKKFKLSVGLDKITVDNELKAEDSKFYEFLREHEINAIYVSGISEKNGLIGVIGVINPVKNSMAKALLKEISVCLSMAISNKKYLNKTERTAVTDSLTGLSNRVAYKKDTVMFNETKPKNFSCVYIDVNELHSINNKYGHSAGDNMLIYIANEIKSFFAGCHIYRMGGDEFLVFVENTSEQTVVDTVEELNKKLSKMDYHISAGIEYKEINTNTETLVKDAEKKMYDKKAEYYQKKEEQLYKSGTNKDTVYMKTGIDEIDSLLPVVNKHYRAVYKVSLRDDTSKGILVPPYMKDYNEGKNTFSEIFSSYIYDMVQPDYRRQLQNFLKFDVLERQLADGIYPVISYRNSQGTDILLSIHPIKDNDTDNAETLWVFENES